MGKGLVNKLWKKDTHHIKRAGKPRAPQKNVAGGLTRTYLTSMNTKHIGDFFFYASFKYLPPLLLVLVCFKQLFLPCKIKAGSITWQSERSHRDGCVGERHSTGDTKLNSDIHKCLKQGRSLGSVTLMHLTAHF